MAQANGTRPKRSSAPGLNGYANCRGLQPSQALVRFDNLFGAAAGQMPASAIILSPKLIVQTGPGSTENTAARGMNVNWNAWSRRTPLASVSRTDSPACA